MYRRLSKRDAGYLGNDSYGFYDLFRKTVREGRSSGTLEVAVFRSAAHGLDRTHAAVALELAPVVDDRLAGRLLHICQLRVT